MEALLSGLLFLISIALIILVLSQPDRSKGMTGGGSGVSIFGHSQDGGVPAKATVVLAILFVSLSLILYLLEKTSI